MRPRKTPHRFQTCAPHTGHSAIYLNAGPLRHCYACCCIVARSLTTHCEEYGIDSMNVNDNQLRRLIIWNRLWLGLFMVLLISWGGLSWANRIYSDMRALRVSWRSGGDIKFSSASDGPFVITHLATVARSEQEKSVARLSQPIVVVDSAGATLSKSEVEKLKWHGYRGAAQPSPAAGTAIVAFYYRPLVTKPSRSQ